jgi:molybdenum cofactor synthesis domain-containing protein
MRTAAALVIGNELLSGKIADKNLVVLARSLRKLGVQLRRVVMTLDETETIAAEVRALSTAHDVVFTSGGVGPTHDDLTIEAVALAFGVPVVRSPAMEAMLRGYYKERITEGHLFMARIPEGARLASSDKVPWPTVVMKNVWLLPGIPEVFQMKIPLIEQELAGDRPFRSFAVLTRLDEGQIKDLLDAIVASHPKVEIGSYPKWNDAEYKTKLTFDGQDEGDVRAARDAFASGLPEGGLVRVLD